MQGVLKWIHARRSLLSSFCCPDQYQKIVLSLLYWFRLINLSFQIQKKCVPLCQLDHSDGKFLGTMECQWFSTCQPLISMVFPMIFPWETMVFQWFFTVGPLVSMVFYRWTIGINGFSNGFLQWKHIWILLPAHDPLKIVAGWHHNIC